ncbi:potassium channel subfamily K member 18-like [Diadema setosum]|uniref:potassium channel subfamily K member 18-like n=1 Tax=Diadema setosum TaxID=31175 RepID=UPI003B3A3B19
MPPDTSSRISQWCEKTRSCRTDFLLICGWFLFLTVGVVLFIFLESKNAKREKAIIREEFTRRLLEIWEFGRQNHTNSSSGANSNITAMVEAIVEDYAEDLGFGHLAAKTQEGRLCCIIYGAFGITINIIIIGKLSRRVMQALGFLYSMFRKFVGACRSHRTQNDADRPENAVVNVVDDAKGDGTASVAYRSEMYGFSNVPSCDISSTLRAHRQQAWSERKNQSDHNYIGSQFLTSSSSTEIKPTSTPPRAKESLVEGRDGERVNKSKPPPTWFVVLATVAYLLLSALCTRFFARTAVARQDLSFLDLCYYQFVVMSTVGFGDLTLVGESDNSFGVIIFSVILMGGMLFLSALFSSAYDSYEAFELQRTRTSLCKLCCKKNGHQRQR